MSENGFGYPGPDMHKEYGPGSAHYDRELADFERRKRELFGAAIDAAGLARALKQPPPVVPPPKDPQVSRTTPFTGDYVAARAGGIGTHDYEKLLGNARFWGIDNPERMDPVELNREVEQRRALVDRPTDLTLPGAAEALTGYAAQVARVVPELLGNATGLVRKIPFAGETLADLTHSEEARAKLKDMGRNLQAYTEDVRASLPTKDVQAMNFLEGAGEFTGYIAPSTWAWKAAGVVGGAGVLGTWAGRLSPFARVALKGASVATALEAGGDKSTEELQQTAAFGAALGIGGELLGRAATRFGPTFGAAAAKVRQQFLGMMPERVPAPEVRLGGDVFGAAPGSNPRTTVDAEWSFVPETGELKGVAPSDLPPTGRVPNLSAPPIGNAGYGDVTGPLHGPAIPMRGQVPEPAFNQALLDDTRFAVAPGETFTPDEAARILKRTGINVAPGGPPEGIEARRLAAQGISKVRTEVASADALGAQISKQQTIIEGPTLPEAVKAPILGDADVAVAAARSNPAGVSIIRNIAAPEGVLARMSGEGVNVGFAARNGGLHMLVGDGVTPEIQAEFSKHGVFTGQRVVTPSGNEVIVRSVAENGIITAQRDGGGPPMRVSASKVQPSRFGVPTTEAPEQWDNFRQGLLTYARDEAAKGGMAPITGMTDPRVSASMQTQLEEFFNARGSSLSERQTLQTYFEHRWADEYRALAPAEMEMVNRAMADNALAASDANMMDDSGPNLDQMAQSKGFVWISAPGRGGQLEDAIGGPGASGTNPRFQSDAAAEAFLKSVDREVPDLAPVSDIPVEVLSQGHGDLPSGNLSQRPAFDEHWQSQRDVLDGLGSGEEAAGGGTGRIPPRGPGPYPGSLENPEGGRFETLGDQFAKFVNERPGDYAAWHQQYMEGVLRHFRVTRYRGLSLEEGLHKQGLDLASPFVEMESLFNATTKAHNEALPWHNRFAHIIRQAPRRLGRTGDWARTHELTDVNQRLDTWAQLSTKYEWDAETHSKVLSLDDQWAAARRDFFIMQTGDPQSALTLEREINRYIPHIRAAQQRWGVEEGYKNITDVDPSIDYFAEYARSGNIDFRNMDMRELTYQMVQGYFNKKHLAEPWERIVKTWSDERIPEDVRAEVIGTARLARYGTDMGHSGAVAALKQVSKTFGVPISNREAVAILNTPIRWSYEAFLGGRSAPIFRDAIQPFKVSLKVGPTAVAKVYGKWLASGEYRAEAMQRGLAGGWIEGDRPQLESAGVFEVAHGTSNATVTLTPAQAARRELLARMGDVLHDNTPSGLVEAYDKVRPLRMYSRLSGGYNRAIAGEIGYNVARDAIAAFRANPVEGAFDKLLDESAAKTFEGPIMRRFEEMVKGGFDEDASQFLARQMVDWSQGRYGQKETMPINRGYTGRLVFMLGNFAPQEIESVASMFNNASSPARKMKMIGGYALIHAALGALAARTGWGFGKWMWAKGAMFSGGPGLQPAMTAAQAAAGMIGVAGGSALNPMQAAATREVGKASLTGFLSNFFPFRGHLQTADQLVQALGSRRPVNNFANYSVTGDRVGTSERRDFFRSLEGFGTRDAIAGQYERPPLLPAGSFSENGGGSPGAFGNMDQSGVADLTRVRTDSATGARIYDSTNKGKDGRYPSHRLDLPSGRLPSETWETYEKRVNDKKITDYNPQDLIPITDMTQLDADVQTKAAEFMKAAEMAGVKLEVNETKRSQTRQELLFKIGRSLPGSPVTWTLTSQHTTGRGIDFRVNDDNSGTDPGYQWLQTEAPKYGFQVLGMVDPGHVAMPKVAGSPTTGGVTRADTLKRMLGGSYQKAAPGSGAMQ